MRKFLIPIAAAASTLALAAPASAQIVQWAPPVYQYNPYNFGNGYNGINFARSMESRVQRIRQDIRVMHDRRVLSRNEARNLDNQAERLQRRIYRASRNGISPGEARSVETQIFNLQRRVAREANDWNNRFGRHRRY
jgi:gas vesicle protein